MNKYIKSVFLRISFLESFVQYILQQKEKRMTIEDLNLDEAETVMMDYPFSTAVKVGLVKERTRFEESIYVHPRDYWPKFERFLKNNKITYHFYDIYAIDWQQKGADYDLIIWHPKSSPIAQQEAENKIYILEKLMGKKCVPSYHEVWPYESKVRMHYFYQKYNLPAISTTVFYKQEEALEFVRTTSFPIISKLDTGSSSYGVEKISARSTAEKLIRKIFSSHGKKTYWPYLNQKGYVLFQQFIPNAKFDLRVIVVGDKYFGYYRYPRKNDFKASGAGIYEKKGIDTRALDIASRAKECFNARFLATDLLFDEQSGEYKIIESSFFIGIDTCEQLVVDGVAGYYEKKGSEYSFKPGKFWVQELLLFEVFKDV